MTFISSEEARKLYHVSSCTLRRWESQNKILTQRTPSGHRLYNVPTTATKPSSAATNTSLAYTPTSNTASYIYARVSSAKQRSSGDLQRQCELLQSRYPNHIIVSDTGSGINFKRPGLKTLLERSSQGLVEEIVVTHRDRLARFAFDLLEHIFTLHQTKIVVLFQESTSDAQELAEDILAINTVYICRMQGKRAAEYRKRRKEAQEQSDGEDGKKITKKTKKRATPHNANAHVSERSSEALIEEVDGCF